MTTARLYYQDAYTHSFDAQVVHKTDDGRRVYLDKTFFYPTSGGQPHDTGVLSGAAVTDVIDEGERIAHVLAEPLPGDLVQARIDWNRRFDHMQQHSGQHLLSAVFLERFGFETLSFHMGPEVSTVELGAKELTPEQIATVEERVNEIVRAAVPLLISFEDAAAVQSLRKESRRTGTLRIIEIQEVDRSACGGTHVRTTAEIGPVQIRGSEKVRGQCTPRIYLRYACHSAIAPRFSDPGGTRQAKRGSAGETRRIPGDRPSKISRGRSRPGEAEGASGRLRSGCRVPQYACVAGRSSSASATHARGSTRVRD